MGNKRIFIAGTLLSVALSGFVGARAADDTFPVIAEVQEFDPNKPFRKKNTCPFECCRIGGQWKYMGSVPLPVYASPKGTKRVASLKNDDVFDTITGDSFITPWKIEIIKGNEYFRKGDLVFILDEGPETSYWHAVYRGRLIDLYGGPASERPNICKQEELAVRSDCTAVGRSPTPSGDNDGEWWVQIKTKSGTVGWILVDRKSAIEGKDGC